jgi:putative glutamine amidotransferase
MEGAMMTKKPLIGINTDFRPAKGNAYAFAWSHAGYFDCVTAAGGIPVLLPQVADPEDLKQVMSRLDGLVLTSCKLDLDPTRLGFDAHPVTRPMPPRREDFDRRLAKTAYEMKVPTLAVGMGMLTLNLMAGGSLFQYLPDDVMKSLQHRDTVEACLRHVIEIVPGTKMDSIYGPGEIRVNSDHHYGIDQVAPSFRVSATAMDGVVEAYESIEENWWALGVQFHPHDETASALDMQVFEAFIEGVKMQQAESEENILSFSNRRAA